MSFKRLMYAGLGILGLIFGAVGAVVPLLPSFPFLLLAAFGFARSSKRLHSWFVNSDLYKNNLASYVEKRGMKKKVKIRIMVVITLLLGFGAVMMHQILWGQLIILAVWVFHMYYFVFYVKTLNEVE